jgi:NAD(P)H-hydrate epimerase
MTTLTREQVRNVDQIAVEKLGLPGIALMENAGRGAAEILLKEENVRRVVICAAGGNNGGDGFVIARHLWLAGRDVEIDLFSSAEKLSGDAATNYCVCHRLGIPIHEHPTKEFGDQFVSRLAQADWIVDALFGTGLSSNVRAPFDRLIETMNSAQAPILAVDLPSGLDCDTGRPLGIAVKATKTVTFVAQKAGFETASSREWTGEIQVSGIGVPPDLASRELVADV